MKSNTTSGPCLEERAIAARLGLVLRENAGTYWWAGSGAPGVLRVWRGNGPYEVAPIRWRTPKSIGFLTSLAAMRAYETEQEGSRVVSKAPPVSGAEDRAQVAALGAVPPGLRPSEDRAVAELLAVCEVLAPVLGDFGGNCDTADGFARRARNEIEKLRAHRDHPELRERARIVRLLLEESDRLWRRATDDGWNQAAALVASEFDALVERVERLT